MRIGPAQTSGSPLSRTHRAKKKFVSLCRWKVSSVDVGAKPNTRFDVGNGICRRRRHLTRPTERCGANRKGLLQESSHAGGSSKSDGAEAKSPRGSSLIGGDQFDGH